MPTPPTPRELQVLQLIANGYGIKLAARELGLSYDTVRNHRARLRRKYQVHTITEVCVLALHNGWID